MFISEDRIKLNQNAKDFQYIYKSDFFWSNISKNDQLW